MLIVSKKHFISGKRIAVDTETTGLNIWHGDAPFCFGFCNEEGVTKVFEWEVDPWTRVVIPNLEDLRKIRSLMEDPKVEKIFHNAKYDVRICENSFGIKTLGRVHDTMFMCHVLNSDEINYKLKDLTQKVLGFPRNDLDMLKRATISGRGKAKKLGWEIGVQWSCTAEGDWKAESAVESDYWIPKALDPSNTLCKTYCRQDVERTMLLALYCMERIEEEDLMDTYLMESDLWPVTYAMESRGVHVDVPTIEHEISEFKSGYAKTKKILFEAAWPDFNPDSSADIRTLLYKKLRLPVKYRTEKGTPQANIVALLDFRDNPVVDSLFRYRSYRNGLTNFFYKYRDFKSIDTVSEGYCLHPEFNQVGPRTGRFSCRHPNLQNVPNALSSRSPVPLQARAPFGPRPGYVWYLPDYSQLEVRIFAAVAQEDTMLATLHAGKDVHTANTNKAWGGEGNPAMLRSAMNALELFEPTNVENEKLKATWKTLGINSRDDIDMMSKKEREDIALQWMKGFNYEIVAAETSLGKKVTRSKGKMVIFAKVFGGGPGAVADLLFCTYDEAAVVMKDYDVAFPKIPEYINNMTRLGRTQGFVHTVFGRRLTVNPKFAYRACNYIIQGSAADLMKRGMLRCARYLKHIGIDAHIVMTIHDELVFEFRKEHAYTKVLRTLCNIMEDSDGIIQTPTPVELSKVTESWCKKSSANIGEWRKGWSLERKRIAAIIDL